MAEAFDDLEQSLKFKKELLTPEERKILLSCRSKILKDANVGAIAGGFASWAVTRKLSKALRISLSAVAGVSVASWVIQGALHSCVDRILTLDGSILQKELYNILTKEKPDAPMVVQLMSKRFYLEMIWDDSTSNSPRKVWRYRNSFSDNVVHGHKTDDLESSRGKSDNGTDKGRTNLEAKHIFKKGGDGPVTKSEADPFDSIFSYGAPVEEIHGNHQNKTSGTHYNRGHRRSHRRRRMRAHEHSVSDSEHAAAD